ncbi:hypothetical protein Daus18300_000815 [Diaporthe australafricana]|uniref:Fungal cellulose binding domain-containing protein n=1 Tax=Diaporthe australafricana TaxID=127596 RepID=A0ABR3Y0D1_9PEZI
MKPATNVLPLAMGAAASPLLSRQAAPNASSCAATTEWAGFSGLKHAFVFGNSYTTTYFNFTQEPYPQPGQPLGNPGYPGYTSSNGPNWIDYLTVKYNQSLFLTYNLAYGGATVDSDLVAPYEPTVLSVKQQVQDEFVPGYTGASPSAPGAPDWTGEDTLAAVWIGINDVGNSYYNGEDATAALYAQIFDVYAGLADTLYDAGARNFLFLNVPPVDRSPLITESGVDGAAAQEKAAIADWNGRVGALASALKGNHSEVNVWSFDANAVFEKVLDDPSSYPQTSGYTNTTGYCEAYENGTSEPDSFVESCGVPVDQYFWLNTLHPTYPVHDVVAEEVAKALEAGPNVCA